MSIICTACVKNHGNRCIDERIGYPRSTQCSSFSSISPAILLPLKKEEKQTEWRIYSNTDKDKCLFYASLP